METNTVDLYSEYISAWRTHETADQTLIQERAVRARKAAEECARWLADRYGVQRVWLFGSLAQPQPAHARTDIDLAAEGLAPRDYFAALASLYSLVEPGVEIDLVPIETAQPTMRERIFREGLILHATEQSAGPDC